MCLSTLPSNSPNGASIAENKKKPRRTKNTLKEGQTIGRWTKEEHQSFLRGFHTYGREWKKVASHIPTRTSAQVRSHAQKYFTKLQKEEDSWADTYASVDNTGLASNAVVTQPNQGTSQALDDSESLPSSIQANVTRIIAHPETVAAEVEDTLRQLRELYEALQLRLEQTSSRVDTPGQKRRSVHVPNDDHSSITSMSVSLQNEEMIAFSVLRGGSPTHGDAGTVGCELSDNNMDIASHHSESTGSVSKKPKHD